MVGELSKLALAAKSRMSPFLNLSVATLTSTSNANSACEVFSFSRTLFTSAGRCGKCVGNWDILNFPVCDSP